MGMLSPAMDTTAVDTDMAVATDMADTDVSMVDTDTERGRLRLLLMLSLAMATTAEDTDTERGALRLMLSPDMDTTAVDMEVMAMDVSMVDTDMVADITDNFLSNSSFLYSNIHSCSKIESCFTSKFFEIKVSK